MAIQKTTEKKIADVVETPEVKPEQVTINDAGHALRNIFARMPEGTVGDDLRNPKIWRRVQGSRQTALIKLDHLFVLAFDESWAARAVVTHATSTEAHLAIEKIFTFKEQGKSFFSDGKLEVFWDGSSYGVRRVSDGVRVVQEGFTTEGQAVAALRNWYPKRVA